MDGLHLLMLGLIVGGFIALRSHRPQPISIVNHPEAHAEAGGVSTSAGASIPWIPLLGIGGLLLAVSAIGQIATATQSDTVAQPVATLAPIVSAVTALAPTVATVAPVVDRPYVVDHPEIIPLANLVFTVGAALIGGGVVVAVAALLVICALLLKRAANERLAAEPKRELDDGLAEQFGNIAEAAFSQSEDRSESQRGR